MNKREKLGNKQPRQGKHVIEELLYVNDSSPQTQRSDELVFIKLSQSTHAEEVSAQREKAY